MTAAPVLSIRHLHKSFDVGSFLRPATLTALDAVDLTLYPGTTTALVGESGSGKSTLARCILGLEHPDSGSIELAGTEIGGLHGSRMRGVYKDVQMVFQDPMASLNPRRTVRQTLEEPMRAHLSLSAARRAERAVELLRLVELGPEHLDRLPQQLSGGQRQRVGIARALAVEPRVVILDEPTSSLDVSVRGRVIALLRRIQAELDLAYLFITHDLLVVQRIADEVAVMYLGQVVEQGPTATVFDAPTHPYTRALLSAAPIAEWGVRRERIRLSGEIPSPIGLAPRCRLVGRCPLEQDVCSTSTPPLLPIDQHHSVACFVAADPAATGGRGELTERDVASGASGRPSAA